MASVVKVRRSAAVGRAGVRDGQRQVLRARGRGRVRAERTPRRRALRLAPRHPGMCSGNYTQHL